MARVADGAGPPGSALPTGTPGARVSFPPLSTEACAALVDRAAVDRVLVHGSPPGQGRDLDLLVRPASERAVRAALLDDGFAEAGHRLARFRGGSVEQVELFRAGDWDLPPEEVEALFAEAVALDGYRWLVRPSPAHTLLIVARRVVEGPGRLDEKRRGYVEWALREDPSAWAHAEARADAWDAGRSLELLERLNGHAFVPRLVRARIVDDRLRHAGRGAAEAHLEVARQMAPRYGAPVVVALSGLDGSGKSTQGRLLVDALERVGIPAAMEWAKPGTERRLWAVRRAAVRTLRRVVHRPAPAAGDGGPGPGDDLDRVGRELRQGSPVLTAAWAAVVCASSIWTYRRQVQRYRGRLQVLVYDRYVLDAAVQLRWRYGLEGAVADLLVRALAALAPRPLRGYLLELPAETAQARKLEDRVEDLDAHLALYRRELDGPAARGVRVLDATRPVEDLAAEIGAEVWSALATRQRRWAGGRQMVWRLARREVAASR